jgi:hypothetical protein
MMMMMKEVTLTFIALIIQMLIHMLCFQNAWTGKSNNIQPACGFAIKGKHDRRLQDMHRNTTADVWCTPQSLRQTFTGLFGQITCHVCCTLLAA